MKALVATVLAFLPLGLCVGPAAAQQDETPVVETTDGRVEGVTDTSGVEIYKGIPYAAPPTGPRRWRPPQPVEPWTGLRAADRFGPRCMQPRPYGDMVFRSEGMSEDCLYLNVWTPEAERDAGRPVLVYFYGGGFRAGDGSEPRYDGASMAREKDLVVVTLNYRLGVFGFLAHPALTAEAPDSASGNYGLLDQQRALEWVQQNIRAFGGDPGQVTIAGESAGSMSVSAHMAAPGSKGLFARAIGESGAVLGARPLPSLDEMERRGTQFAEQVGADSLRALRARSASRLLELAAKPDAPRFGPAVDGRFLPTPPSDVYAAGAQADVPLLVGWNSEESNYRALTGDRPPTPAVYAEAVRERFGDRADRVLELYPADTWQAVLRAGTALASDQFIGFSTWKWSEAHRRTGAPVYRYFYTHPRPPMKPGAGNDVPGLAGAPDRPRHVQPPRGAVHSAEIEYALGNLDTNALYAWTPADRTVSRLLQGYFARFVKTGDPNGAEAPLWPAAGTGERARLLEIDETPAARPEQHRERYRFWMKGTEQQ
ncbi:MAG: carboxylesterase/lipase family protein [Salinibacter sp.]